MREGPLTFPNRRLRGISCYHHIDALRPTYFFFFFFFSCCCLSPDGALTLSHASHDMGATKTNTKTCLSLFYNDAVCRTLTSMPSFVLSFTPHRWFVFQFPSPSTLCVLVFFTVVACLPLYFIGLLIPLASHLRFHWCLVWHFRLRYFVSKSYCLSYWWFSRDSHCPPHWCLFYLFTLQSRLFLSPFRVTLLSLALLCTICFLLSLSATLLSS